MTIQRAAAIVQRMGPCRVLIDADEQAELARELVLMGCVASEGPGRLVAVIALPETASPATLAACLAPAAAAADGLVLLGAGQAREPVEAAVFAAGWRRHPAGMLLGEYAQRDQPALAGVNFYARAPAGPVDDALVRGDAEADSHLALLAIAAGCIRHGDRVLVCGAGDAGDAAVLTALSRAGSVVVLGAAVSTGHDVMPVEDLASLEARSFDFVLAMDGGVTGLAWDAQLPVYAGLLRPDGRIMVGWSQDERAGTAAAPRDWATLTEALSEYFLIEGRHVLAAPGHPIPNAPRVTYPVPTEGDHVSGWLIAVASCNPLGAEDRRAAFTHLAFPLPAGPVPPVIDFGTAYDNPYLYRSMVQLGERLNDTVLLARLAECVVEDSRPESADRGAALAVLGYRVLEMRMTGAIGGLMPLIAEYCALESSAPHVVRWQVSLAFLAGRLCELAGDPAGAIGWYGRAAAGDWMAFSPILATKVVAACFYEARLHLAQGDVAAATARFRRGVAVALEAAAAPHAAQLGDPDRPTPFYLTELAEVMDMGSQCANALAHLPLWARDPGLFWRQVDIRRFGLVSWARDLERENTRLSGA